MKKRTTQQDFFEQLNYRNKIVMQDIRHPHKVLYNTSGTNLAAVVIQTADFSMIYERRVVGFIQDVTTYTYDAYSLEEAHYLCALLNAPCVDEAIKKYQARSIGIRHIHRTPFEACAIPPYVATDPDHAALVALSQAAHTAIADLKQMDGLNGGVVTNRRRARAAVAAQLAEIDVIARRVLGLDG
jgi:hypothetical protein